MKMQVDTQGKKWIKERNDHLLMRMKLETTIQFNVFWPCCSLT